MIIPYLDANNIDIKGFSDAITIKDPDISYAVYGRLETTNDVDFYKFAIKSPMDIHAGLIVPEASGYRDYYPTLAVVGPGLAKPVQPLPFTLP